MTPIFNYAGNSFQDLTITMTGTSNYDATWLPITANGTNQITINAAYMQQLTQAMQVPASNIAPSVALPSGFNRYVNASDLLEEFIGWLVTQHVRQGDVMGLPIELFIKWLVVRACEEDRVEPAVTLELPASRPQPRCLGCQKFMSRATVLPLHGDRCASLYFTRELVAA